MMMFEIYDEVISLAAEGIINIRKWCDDTGVEGSKVEDAINEWIFQSYASLLYDSVPTSVEDQKFMQNAVDFLDMLLCSSYSHSSPAWKVLNFRILQMESDSLGV